MTLYKWAALAGIAGITACGEVTKDPQTPDAQVDAPGADAGVDAPVPPATFRGTMTATPTVAFGGTPFCNYTITMRDLQLTLGIRPTGEVQFGTFTAVNEEGKDTACTAGVIPRNTASYTLSRVTPIQGGYTLAFRFISGDPPAELVVTLTPMGATYRAAMAFHRSNQTAPLDWRVSTTLTLNVAQ